MVEDDATGAARSLIASHGAGAFGIAEHAEAVVRQLGMERRARWWKRVALAIKKTERHGHCRKDAELLRIDALALRGMATDDDAALAAKLVQLANEWESKADELDAHHSAALEASPTT